MVDVSSGRKTTKPKPQSSKTQEALNGIMMLAASMGQDPLVLANMAVNNPDALASAMDQNDVPFQGEKPKSVGKTLAESQKAPVEITLNPDGSTNEVGPPGSDMGTLPDTWEGGSPWPNAQKGLDWLRGLPTLIEDWRTSHGGQPEGAGLSTYPAAPAATSAATPPPATPPAVVPTSIPIPGPFTGNRVTGYPEVAAASTASGNPQFSAMAANPNNGAPFDTGATTGGDKSIGSLLAALSAVQAPPAPVGQKIDTPAPPRPTGQIQSGQLATMLAQLMGTGGFKPTQLTLANALK